MASKKEDAEVFGGFDTIFDALATTSPGTETKEYEYDNYSNEDEEIEKQEEIEEEPAEEDEDYSDSEEESNEVDEEVEEINEEVEIISPFVDLFSKELGWDLGDDKPKNIKELVDYMSDIIDTNSKPNYHSQEIAELDEFVKNGGNVKEFFEKVYSGSEYNMDNLESVSNQKLIVKELLKIKGVSDQKIEKTIDRYQDAGVLEEEAEDALEIVKEHKEELKKKLLEDQKKEHEEYIKRQQNYISNVANSIDELESIRGIPISKKDKQFLLDYIFKVGPNGKTAFQKDYSENVTPLIESAFFTMKKGEDLTKTLKSKAQSNAITEFKKKLKDTTKRNKSDINRDLSTNTNDMISAISRHLIKPN